MERTQVREFFTLLAIIAITGILGMLLGIWITLVSIASNCNGVY